MSGKRTSYAIRDSIIHWSGWLLVALGWIVLLGMQVLTQVVHLPWGWTGSGIRFAGWMLQPLFFLTGFSLVIRVRKLRAVNAEELLARDKTPPVVYLRSFRDDGPDAAANAMQSSGLLLPTPEERLAIAMSRMGPFVAIGRPGEKLPELGAARLYVSGEAWQSVVMDLLRRARLVVLRVGNTEGFWWEVEQVLKTVDIERVLFFFFGPAADKLYGDFKERAGRLLNCSLPERLDRAQFLYFERSGGRVEAKFVRLKTPKLNFMGNSAIEEMYIRGLRPIFERLALPVPKHSFPFVFKFLIAMLIFVVINGIAVWQIQRMLGTARTTAAAAHLHSIRSALEMEHLQSGRFPTALDALVARGMLRPSQLMDPWGRPFTYRPTPDAKGFEIFSLGADGVEGGDGPNADIKVSR